MRVFRRHDLAANAIGNYAGLLQSCLRKKNRKFLTAIAGSYIDLAQRGAQTLGGYLQRAIASLMSIAIVIELKVIDVDHHEAQRIIVTLRAAQFFRQSGFEVTPIMQLRKRIGYRHNLELIRPLLPGSAFEGQRDLRGHQFNCI